MEGNNVKSFENLCRIFEMRIKLDKEKKVKTPSDVLINYEKYAKKIDNIYNEDFEKDIRPLISPSKTIEEEKKRLEKLIKLLEDRLDKRNDLEDRYYIATGDYISGLQIIISDKELNEKKERLSLINKYIETNNEIDNVNDSISKLKLLLNEEEQKKEEYKTKNQIMEDELYSEFMNVVKEDNSYINITEDNIDEELDNIKVLVKESKETLDVTRDSVKNLITSGLEDDYTSYVEEAEKGYFVIKNKELYLKLYKLVSTFEDDFNSIFTKRENISEILKERKILREDLSITDIDDLLSFEKKVVGQIDIINKEKEVLENISNYTNRIEFKENRLEELENDNNSVEILAILREFNLIDTYDNDEYEIKEEIDSDIEEETIENSIQEEQNIIKEVIDPYRIKEIREAPLTLNLGLAKLKGEAVREKVNKKLNPKPISFDDVLLTSKEETSANKEKDLPKEESTVSEVKEEIVKEESPIWEIPKLDDTVPVINEIKEEIPVWNVPSNNDKKESVDNVINTIPLWEDIKPKFDEEKEEVPSLDITPENNNMNNENSFWKPVSNDKLESSSFPNINIPISGLSSDDNFGFPDLNS